VKKGVPMVRTWWRLPALALPLLCAACASPGRGTGGRGRSRGARWLAEIPAVRQVWVIELENEGTRRPSVTGGRPVPGPGAAAIVEIT
jgi:hypothetical protein